MPDDFNAAAKAMRKDHGRDALQRIEQRIADNRRGGDPEIIDYCLEVRRAYLALYRL